jgi:membrane associated rhomboid family serine protease
MGSAGFIITYMAAGIFGYVNTSQSLPVPGTDKRTQSNVLGGNFALPGIPSVGASGAIFGMFAVSNLSDSNLFVCLLMSTANRWNGLTCLLIGGTSTDLAEG